MIVYLGYKRKKKMTKKIATLLLTSTMLFAANGALQGVGADEYQSFFRLAKSGDVDSQAMLGEMYLDGIGVRIDHDKAFFWLSKAAHSGDPQAQYLLGMMYENGLKVAQNMKRAVEWYEKAAAQNDAMAQYNLAMIYKDGKGGIKKDLKKARHLIEALEHSRKALAHQASL